MAKTKTTYHPTLVQLWAWWRECEDHLETCCLEECGWYWAFVHFLRQKGLVED